MYYALFLCRGYVYLDLDMSKNNLCRYECPNWALTLKHIPEKKIKFIDRQTPIHEWNLPQAPENFKISIKRDDLTGCTLSGNKIRKLEFLLADAVQKGCCHILASGHLQSNQSRTIAVAAREIGLEPHLFLRSEMTKPDPVYVIGNFLLDMICKADIYIFPKNSIYERDIRPKMEETANKIKKETGEESYLISPDCEVGLFGYISLFEELICQGVLENFDDIVVACMSGVTFTGICVANYLTGSRLKCHSFFVSYDKNYYRNFVQKSLDVLGLHIDGVAVNDLIDIIECHKDPGYGFHSKADIEFITSVAKETGIILDPVYTGKAARSLVHELHTNPTRFQGNRILFIHTGGVFGLMNGKLDTDLMEQAVKERRIHILPDMKSPSF